MEWALINLKPNNPTDSARWPKLYWRHIWSAAPQITYTVMQYHDDTFWAAPPCGSGPTTNYGPFATLKVAQLTAEMLHYMENGNETTND
jgi:hypothetical protein